MIQRDFATELAEHINRNFLIKRLVETSPDSFSRLIETKEIVPTLRPVDDEQRIIEVCIHRYVATYSIENLDLKRASPQALIPFIIAWLYENDTEGSRMRAEKTLSNLDFVVDVNQSDSVAAYADVDFSIEFQESIIAQATDSDDFDFEYLGKKYKTGESHYWVAESGTVDHINHRELAPHD